MSEYQYYEFLAIDRPLSAREMDHLRTVSTGARITPVSFINEYNRGNFKGDSMEFMRRFFDAHVYPANWGEALFMVRLPLEAIDEQAIRALCTSSYVTAEKLPHHWLLTWSLLGDTEDYDPCDFVEETGWMARLAPVRAELLRGDLRSLYIGWLRAVTTGEVSADNPEPLTLKGLGELTLPQQALAELLAVDQDLLAGAGIGNPPLQPAEVNATVVDAWLDQLPQPEIKKYLRLLLSGKGIEAERELKRHYAAWQTERMPEAQGTCRPGVRQRLRCGLPAVGGSARCVQPTGHVGIVPDRVPAIHGQAPPPEGLDDKVGQGRTLPGELMPTEEGLFILARGIRPSAFAKSNSDHSAKRISLLRKKTWAVSCMAQRVIGEPGYRSMARGNSPTCLGSVMEDMWLPLGRGIATRRSAAGLRSARPVAMACMDAKNPQSLSNCGFDGHLQMVLDNDMAEKQGFEPWVGLPPQRFSRPSRSTAPALLRVAAIDTVFWRERQQFHRAVDFVRAGG